MCKTTTAAIDKAYENEYEARTYLGLSQVGHHCPRYLWYCYNNYPQPMPEGRILRLFQLGNVVEDQTIADLKKAGISHFDSQLEVSFEHEGITLRGHIDGKVKGLPENPDKEFLFEHKTCSDKKFTELTRCNNYKLWNEQYWWQVQFYMLGLSLKSTLVIVYNKNTSELYHEFIPIEEERTINKLTDVFNCLLSDQPPERVCPTASWYQAKWCPFYRECFKCSLTKYG